MPATPQQLWRQHECSLLSRSWELYRKTGEQIAKMSSGDDFTWLANWLCEQLRSAPSPKGGGRDALRQTWGHLEVESMFEIGRWMSEQLLNELQARTLRQGIDFLLESTALGELGSWLGGEK